MASTDKDLVTIGRAEHIAFPELDLHAVPARIDTGAKTSALWVSSAHEQDGMLSVVLFGEGSPFYTGKALQFDEYDTVVVASSTGEARERYKVKLLVRLAGRTIRAWFTLADRSTQAYPLLIGRNVLSGKFIVDVKRGTIAREAERRRTNELRLAAGEPKNEEQV